MKLLRTMSATLTAVAVTAAMSTVASAEPSSAPAGLEPGVAAAADVEVTFDEYRALFDDLKSSDVPRTQETVDGVEQVTFEIDGFEMTLADVPESDFSPNLGGGFDGGGPYVTFNQVDQTALLTGGAAALTAAICLIPAVGQVACAVAGVIVAVATVYANAYGRCPNEGELKVYVVSRAASCI